MLNLKNILLSGAIALSALGAPVASQAADVGVSISIGDPNFYGRIDLGNTRPDLIYAQPVVIQRVQAPPPPIYLRVPPGYERNWSRHCARYGACGRPVYFVRDTWYRDVYAPQYHRDHPRPDRGRNDWRDDRRHDDHRDDHRGPGRGPDRKDRDDRRDRDDRDHRDDHGRGR